MSDTIEQFSSEMIKAIIQDLSHHHQRLANRTRYRKIICQIACRGAVTCIQEGKEKEALWLIENGIDINAFDGLELMTAIKKNNNIIAKKLIDEGIVINSREMNDNPLVSAIRFSNAFLVEELMKNTGI